MPRRGKAGRENRKRHQCICTMCGVAFFAARPDAVTESNRCRSHLRRWRQIYGAAPINPPGAGAIRPAYWNRPAWFRAYVDLAAYKRLHGKLPAGVGPAEDTTSQARLSRRPKRARA